ncbi:PEP motif putative anchor domain protein [Oleidesulfovibrio alaskensis G20]|uniref:PEP motif putative anchor domain protein n=2 Tax=Oleidesulfovibrio alaskensis TaxID=58180 RepID=Q314M2_OLEA2|nr:PEP-CTERM sorting domain-containing protein [Oleidesulfovibrio alaskensis]ABB37624.1 PEP motif putative anchor domain protein [Oleidesulfovibrio alaskensis G20]MBG0773544.1 PEP-CTERM sorting domain-containing protein [Oleidesulfovibrio alaskensis]
MKRFATLFIAAGLVLSITASAFAGNVFESMNKYDIKYKGYEIAYLGNNPTGTGTIPLDYDTAANLATTGLPVGQTIRLAALLYATSIWETPIGSNLESEVYNHSNSPGTYTAVLTGLSASTVVDADNDGTYDYLLFSGGTVSWYFNALDSSSSLINAPYSEATFDLFTRGDNFVNFDLAEAFQYNGVGYTGWVSISDTTRIDATFLGETDNPMFDNNSYGQNGDGYDIQINATLKEGTNGWTFAVDDPAKTTVIPEPGTFVLVGIGLLLSVFFMRRRQA